MNCSCLVVYCWLHVHHFDYVCGYLNLRSSKRRFDILVLTQIVVLKITRAFFIYITEIKQIHTCMDNSLGSVCMMYELSNCVVKFQFGWTDNL